jgi:hypothetical protein
VSEMLQSNVFVRVTLFTLGILSGGILIVAATLIGVFGSAKPTEQAAAMPPPPPPTMQKRPHGKLPSGIGYYFHLASDYRLYPERSIQETTPQPDGYIFCMGQIVYLDERGARRSTGFCRMLDAVRERWLPVENEEYEHAH